MPPSHRNLGLRPRNIRTLVSGKCQAEWVFAREPLLRVRLLDDAFLKLPHLEPQWPMSCRRALAAHQHLVLTGLPEDQAVVSAEPGWLLVPAEKDVLAQGQMRGYAFGHVPGQRGDRVPRHDVGHVEDGMAAGTEQRRDAAEDGSQLAEVGPVFAVGGRVTGAGGAAG